MNLGIFLASGDGFKNMAKTGQDALFKNQYLKAYSKNFKKVYIFTYHNERPKDLPSNVFVVSNKYSIHRFAYQFIIFLIFHKQIKDCDVIRCFHLFGTIPAIIVKIFYKRPFAFNYAYDYEKFSYLDNRRLNLLLLKVTKILALRFSNVIFVANKKLIKKLNTQKCLYMPNGTDTRLFRPMSLNKEKQITNVLAVGRLEKQKNYENLIIAIKNVNMKLTIVGQGSLESTLKQLAKSNNVSLNMIPKIQNDKMPEIYNKFKLFVIPSHIEGSPKALLEAMSCGLVAIGSKAEGVEEVIVDKSNGILCSRDPKSIANALNYLLKHKEILSKLSSNARTTIINNFNLEKIINIEISMLKRQASK